MEVQRNAWIETNTKFGNFNGVNIFKVAKETIKQMKRLQNPGMVNGNDRNDMEDMEKVEHQGENENHELTTTENNPNMEAKDEKIKSMLIEALAIHEVLTKNFLESNLKKKCNIAFPYILIFGQIVMNDS